MRRRLAVLSLLVALIALLVWALPWLVRVGVGRLEPLLAEAVHMPVRIDGVEIDWSTLRVRIERFQFGDDAGPALLVSGADLSIDVIESITAMEPIVSGTAQSVLVDVPRWPEPKDEGNGKGKSEEGLAVMFPLFALRVEHLEVGDVRVVAPSGEMPLEIAASGVGARGGLQVSALPVDVTAATLTLRRGKVDVRAVDVAARGVLEADGITLDAGRFRGDFGAVEAEASARRDLRVKASVDLASLLAQLGVDAPVRGRAALDGSVRGDLIAPTVDAEVSIEQPVVERLEGKAAKATIRLEVGAASSRDQTKLEIRQAQWQGPGLDVSGSGSLAFDAPLTFDAEITGTAADLRSVGDSAGIADLSGAGQVEATISGTFSPLALGAGRVKARGTHVRRAGASKGLEIAADAVIDCEPVPAESIARNEQKVTPGLLCRRGRLDATVDLGAGNRASGRLALVGDEGLSGETRVEIADAAALSPLLPGFSAGRANARADLGGTLSEPTARGRFEASGLVIASTRIDSMTGGFALDPAALQLEAISLNGLGGRGTVDGRIALRAGEPSQCQASIEAIDLESVWLVANSLGASLPYFKGTLNGRGRAEGTWERLTAEVELAAAPLVIETERFAAVRTVTSFRDGTWRTVMKAQRRADETLTAEGDGRGFQARTLTVRSSPWELSGFGFWRGTLDELGGTLVIQADLSGDLRHPRGDAQLLLSEVTANGRTLGAMEVVATGTAKGWLLRAGEPGTVGASTAPEERAASPLAITVSLTDAPGYPFDATVELRSFDLAALLSSGSDLRTELDATVKATGRLSQIAVSLRLDVVAPRFEVVHEDIVLRTEAPIRIHGRGQRFEIEAATLSGPLGRTSATGFTEIGGRTALTINVDTKAEILEIVPGVTSAAGELAADVQISREPGGHLRLRGDGAATNLALDVGLSIGLNQGTIRMKFGGGMIEVAEAQGKVGGGEVSLSCGIEIARGPALHWKFEEVSTGMVPDLDDRLSGEGDLDGTWQRPRLSGTVTILSALYDRRIQLQDVIPSFQRQVAEAPRESGTPIDLDLRLVAPDGIYLDTPFAMAELAADLRIQGTTAAPRVGGRGETLSGEVLVGRSTMEVVEGVIDFNDRPKINPDLRFTATATVISSDSSYDVTARVVGTLAEPRILLSSDDPGLTQNDIFSLLTFGRTSTEMRAAGGGVALGDVLSLAPTLYSRQVSRDIAGALPVDRVSFEPTFSTVTGSFEPRVSLGKDLTDRLAATVSSTFADRQLYSAGLEFRLSPRTRVFGLWESGTTDSNEGAFGGGFSFKQEFRDVPCFSLWRVCARRGGGKK